MKCDVCKEAEATVHLTQIVGGEMKKMDLCEPCAKAKGISDPAGFSLADQLLGLGHSTPVGGGTDLKCPSCGMTQLDFKKSGRLGCAQCYETFAEGLTPLLKGMHKGEQHVGKAPATHKEKPGASDQMKALRRELEHAVKSENFEAAAEIRDKIRKLGQE